VPERGRKEWEGKGGAEVELLLRSGAVAVLDAKWVVALSKRGGIISRRQELPDEAFLTLDEIVAAGLVSGGLRLALVSYPWLHPSHPDPKGTTLALLAKVLEAYLAKDKGVWALFWDYASLHQHPSDGSRSPLEDALFKQGLGGLGTMYAHQFTTVFRITRPPVDYPAAYDLPPDANTGTYDMRGWCTAEAAWSMMTKYYDFSLDLGLLEGGETRKEEIVRKCTKGGGRKPPLLPDEFEQVIATKSFTNGKDDRPLVARLYRDSFAEQFGKVKALNYGGLGWGDAEAAQLARVIGSGALPKLDYLNLARNQIRDQGMTAFAGSLGKGGLPSVTFLNLYLNTIGQQGMAAFADSLGKGGLPSLKKVVVDECHPQLVAACEPRGIEIA